MANAKKQKGKPKNRSSVLKTLRQIKMNQEILANLKSN
jgi:hypothetical protein